MRRFLKTALISSFSVSIIACGGGGGGLSNDAEIKLKKLEVQNQYRESSNPLIYPDEEFYIKWDVSYSGESFYSINIYALSNTNVPDYDDETNKIEQVNCLTNIVDCSKGLKCIYKKDESPYGEPNYYVMCASYFTLPGSSGWEDYKFKKHIDPYQTNYIGATAYVIQYEPDLKVKAKQDKKAVPVRFAP